MIINSDIFETINYIASNYRLRDTAIKLIRALQCVYSQGPKRLLNINIIYIIYYILHCTILGTPRK